MTNNELLSNYTTVAINYDKAKQNGFIAEMNELRNTMVELQLEILERMGD